VEFLIFYFRILIKPLIFIIFAINPRLFFSKLSNHSFPIKDTI